MVYLGQIDFGKNVYISQLLIVEVRPIKDISTLDKNQEFQASNW